LPFADAEAHGLRGIVERAGGTIEIGSGLNWLRDASQSASHIVVSTHAVFNPADPYASRFVLDSGKGGLILAGLLAGALPLVRGASIYANACETAMIEARLAADEHLGFPGAFLLAGARFVLASLWRVEDVSAALFSLELMRRRAAGESASEAAIAAMEFVRTLQKTDAIQLLETLKVDAARADLADVIETAVRRLRNGPEAPFEHPIYWRVFRQMESSVRGGDRSNASARTGQQIVGGNIPASLYRAFVRIRGRADDQSWRCRLPAAIAPNAWVSRVPLRQQTSTADAHHPLGFYRRIKFSTVFASELQSRVGNSTVRDEQVPSGCGL
jgi:hypothetical protein